LGHPVDVLIRSIIRGRPLYCIDLAFIARDYYSKVIVNNRRGAHFQTRNAARCIFCTMFISSPGFSRHGLCFASVTFFVFLFNDRLEQRDLGNYKTDLHQIFRVGRHAGVNAQSGIERTLSWQPILRHEIGRNRRHVFTA